MVARFLLQPLRHTKCVVPKLLCDRPCSALLWKKNSLEDPSLARSEEKIKSFAIIYLVDVKEVPDFNTMYEWLGSQLRYDAETCDNHDDNGRSPYITIMLAVHSGPTIPPKILGTWFRKPKVSHVSDMTDVSCGHKNKFEKQGPPNCTDV